jgi:hypothetical protein
MDAAAMPASAVFQFSIREANPSLLRDLDCLLKMSAPGYRGSDRRITVMTASGLSMQDTPRNPWTHTSAARPSFKSRL